MERKREGTGRDRTEKEGEKASTQGNRGSEETEEDTREGDTNIKERKKV